MKLLSPVCMEEYNLPERLKRVRITSLYASGARAADSCTMSFFGGFRASGLVTGISTPAAFFRLMPDPPPRNGDDSAGTYNAVSCRARDWRGAERSRASAEIGGIIRDGQNEVITVSSTGCYREKYGDFLNTTPEWQGMEFDGWYDTPSNSGGSNQTANDLVTGDITLYAHWK